ncbi:subtilase cytotoxin subunit B-like protein, partial [Escherichia coli]|nr:subtilase cytotoxin subunit B-like protein [Escherichia coli]
MKRKIKYSLIALSLLSGTSHAVM